jgi:hypothetical protein
MGPILVRLGLRDELRDSSSEGPVLPLNFEQVDQFVVGTHSYRLRQQLRAPRYSFTPACFGLSNRTVESHIGP